MFRCNGRNQHQLPEHLKGNGKGKGKGKDTGKNQSKYNAPIHYDKQNSTEDVANEFINFLNEHRNESNIEFNVPLETYDKWYNHVEKSELKHRIVEWVNNNEPAYKIELDFKFVENYMTINYIWHDNNNYKNELNIISYMTEFEKKNNYSEEFTIENVFYDFKKLSEIARSLNIRYIINKDKTKLLLTRVSKQNDEIDKLNKISNEYENLIVRYITSEMITILNECSERKCSIDKDFLTEIKEISNNCEYENDIIKLKVNYTHTSYNVQHTAKMIGWNLTYSRFINNNSKYVLRFIRDHNIIEDDNKMIPMRVDCL